LIAMLAREQETDTKKRDSCKEQYQDISQESSKLQWKIKNNEAHIQKLDNLIQKREEEKGQTVKEMADTTNTINDMKDERAKENQAFIQAKKDDLAAIELMQQARETLMEYYKKNGVKMGAIQGSVNLLQEDPLKSAETAPDASFSGKDKRKGQSKGIVAIMTMLIEDLQAEVKNEVEAEKEAQISFEKTLASAEQLMQDLEAKKVSLEQAVAQRSAEKTSEDNDKNDNTVDLDDQTKQKKAIQADCDFMLEKYTERRKHRDAESQALVEAKEFLSNYYSSADTEA